MRLKKNIIYLCNTEKGASGGAKIIYHHSELINNLNNFSSQVIHIKKKKTAKWKTSFNKKFKISKGIETGWQLNEIEASKKFKYDWFKNKISIKENLNFEKKKDFVILPEIFAHLASDLLIKNKIKYAIFVQNGYSINFTNNLKKLELAYSKAEFILSYSSDISECIKLNFPKLKTEIIKIKYSIASNSIKKKVRKKNLITYMSRKLPVHSNHVVLLLKKYLPKNWNIKDLNNIDEKLVYRNLQESKVFLAFSNLEGLPLPPVEAALAGNYVVGYTGEGGKDYWKKPIFTEIYSGDIRNFVQKTLEKVNKYNSKNKMLKQQYNKLAKEFSKQNEIIHIKKFLKKTL